MRLRALAREVGVSPSLISQIEHGKATPSVATLYAIVSQLDDAGVNALMNKACDETDPAARAAAWGEVDRAITGLAPAIPLVWDKTPMAHSADVATVANETLGVWDFSFTSLR